MQNTEIAVQPLAPQQPIATTSADLIMDPGRIQSLMAFADVMAKSAITVPKHLQGKQADCLAVAMQATQWGMNPFAVAQKTHLVNGVLGYEAQLVNAVVQSTGAIVGAFNYEYEGDGNNLSCRVGAVLRGDNKVTWGQWLSIADVQTKNSPLWKTNPAQQLGYLQVKNWARAYCPGAILGVYTVDELSDIPAPVQMGRAEEVPRTPPQARPTLQPYSAEDFERNLPAWLNVIASGRKSADDIIAMASTKGTLSEEQQARIRNGLTIDAESGEILGSEQQQH